MVSVSTMWQHNDSKVISVSNMWQHNDSKVLSVSNMWQHNDSKVVSVSICGNTMILKYSVSSGNIF